MLFLAAPAGAAPLLTETEQRWLDEHPVISLALERNYAPFSFIDEQGRPRGLSVDYIRLLERRLGRRFKLVRADSLALNLAKARAGQVDVLSSVMRTAEREAYLRFTKPYVSVPAVLVVRDGYNGPVDLARLSGRRVALGRAYAVEAYLAAKFPELNLVKVSDDVAALNKLAFGEVDAAVVDVASASSIIAGHKITKLRLAATTGFTYDLSFATRRDAPELNRILQKTLEQISPAEHQAIYRKWVQLERPLPRSLKFFGYLGILMLVSIFAVLLGQARWNRSLKGLVEQRTRALEQELERHRRIELELSASEFKFRSLAENIREAFWIVSPDWNRVEYISPAYELIWGRSCEQLYAAPRSWLDDVFDADRATLITEIAGQGYQDLRNPNFMEFRIRRADGAIRWIKARAYPIWDAAGRLAKIAGVAEDVTERKQSLAEMAVVAEISRLFQRSDPEIFAELARIIRDKLRFPLVMVELYEAASREMVVVGTAGFARHLNDFRIALEHSIAAKVVATGQTICAASAASDQAEQTFSEFRALRVEAFLCVPISFDERIFGTLAVADRIWRSDVEAWAPILEAIAAFLGHEIRRRQIGENLLKSEQRFKAIADYTYDWESWIAPDGRPVWVSPSVERLTGYGVEECLKLADYPLPLAIEADRAGLTSILTSARNGSSGNNLEFRICRKDGRLVWGAISWQPIYDAAGVYLGLRASVRDITERRQAGEIMRVRLHLLQFSVTHSLHELLTETLDSLGRLTDSPLGFFHFVDGDQLNLSLQAWSSATLAGLCQAGDAGQHYAIDQAGVWADCVQQRRPVIHNDYMSLPNRKGLPAGHVPVVRELSVPVVRNDKVVAVLGIGNKPSAYEAEDVALVAYLADLAWDIVERKQAELEREKLQAQLLQAQKMESVGRLAGGVAHDFNNMLMVIIGHAEMGLGRLEDGAPLADDLKQIRNAALRSSDLTAQLLAFARQQPVNPKVLDLNVTVSGMFKMLSRLIGEDVELMWKPGQDLWPVELDPSQVDQILANLVVNARDALGGGGAVTIETANSVLDEHYCQQHADCLPGEYVMLAVSDTGKGMDSETMQHIFEPFFTTKATGKGTGLGLAMVYGAIHQNRGFINVYSELGLGTTFKIYLPRVQASAGQAPSLEQGCGPTQGSETVLLVEDEAALLDLGKAIFENQGYKVLAAQSPSTALKLATEHGGPLHLLVTDVVMPEMNGRELTKAVVSVRPGVKTLFMSGYPAEVIAHHGVIEAGVNFLQKPFSAKVLAHKVREVLDT